MGLFDNRKKKKIINTIQLNNNSLEKIDDDFFNEYDYKVISKLEPNDYRLPIIYLRRLLDTIAIVGKKLNNIDVCQENFLVLQNMLKTKEDYLYLDSFCSKYNQNEIVNYIDENNPLSITDITVEKLDDFLKLKEFKKQKLTQNQYVPDIIKTYKDAINYEKINSYLSENGNFVNYFYKNFDWVNELCTSINFDELTQEQKNNLIDYFSLRTSTSIKIEINNYEDLLNYRTIKQEKLDETFNLDPKIALYYTIFKTENIYDIINTMQKCPKLSEINNIAPETLTNQFGFNPSEIEIVKILSTIQTKDKLKLSELYERYRNSENYIEVNTFEFQNKIRNIYGAEIATSLTKTTDDKKLKSLGSEKYGIPIYEKEDGEFKFLIHGIKKSLKLNIRIGSAIQDKTYFNNPELWDTLPKELGTNTLSTSIISSNGLTCFNSTNQDAVFYGFDECESSSIRNISVSDGATNDDLATARSKIDAYLSAHNLSFIESLGNKIAPRHFEYPAMYKLTKFLFFIKKNYV